MFGIIIVGNSVRNSTKPVVIKMGLQRICTSTHAFIFSSDLTDVQERLKIENYVLLNVLESTSLSEFKKQPRRAIHFSFRVLPSMKYIFSEHETFISEWVSSFLCQCKKNTEICLSVQFCWYILQRFSPLQFNLT
jgi:hypothetical protein